MDVVTHLGGFLTGLLLGSLLAFAPRLNHRPLVILAAGFFSPRSSSCGGVGDSPTKAFILLLNSTENQ
jgi:hypothetical protein